MKTKKEIMQKSFDDILTKLEATQQELLELETQCTYLYCNPFYYWKFKKFMRQKYNGWIRSFSK